MTAPQAARRSTVCRREMSVFRVHERIGPRSRFIAAALVLLTLHAALLGFTHHHESGPRLGWTSATLQDSSDDEPGDRGAGGPSQCPVCRLQRSFESAAPPPSATLEPLKNCLDRQPGCEEQDINCGRLMPSSRAPPRA